MRITPPERGQPLDISYLYQIADSINELNSALAPSRSMSVVDNKNVGDPTTASIHNLSFFASTISLSPGKVNDKSSQDWSIEFQNTFSYAPIVTATVKSAKSTTGSNIVVMLSEVTSNKASGTVYYNVEGNISIEINVIAIGIAGTAKTVKSL